MRKFLFLAAGLALLISLQSAHAGIVGDLGRCKAYNINVIAYDKCPKAENAQRIAVMADFINDPAGELIIDLDRRNKIFLGPGDRFTVSDSNACDSNGAFLQVPPETGDEFQVWTRLVGKPGSQVQHYLCRTDTGSGTIVCQAGAQFRTRLTGKGNPAFTNVTNELLRIGSESLFDQALEEYFWTWNTIGKPHAQVWFIDSSCLESLD